MVGVWALTRDSAACCGSRTKPTVQLPKSSWLYGGLVSMNPKQLVPNLKYQQESFGNQRAITNPVNTRPSRPTRVPLLAL
ncbi:hypothetical protein GBF38_021434 [Nibea albiflora]|uniref:Uncharacterized protein n=1 Tax=Nibea albiflora TaxID=240163 RepID=A0ACB7FFI3_NIBAL|nr:hypothetical protein GBF38_021434 [Nibea albiflora]